MKGILRWKALVSLSLFLCLTSVASATVDSPSGMKKIFVVSSYDREYLWSKETNRGLCDALLKLNYFDNQEQIVEYTKNDLVETSRMVLKKMWMNAKKKPDKNELIKVAAKIVTSIKEFTPDLIFLGDDEAGEYVGVQLLDAKTPMVMWGFNHNPVKYGLVDSAERPGHNVTGVYQSGYKAESLHFLKVLVPQIKTFAILTDETPSGRSNLKEVESLVRKGEVPLELVASVSTSNSEEWKQKALELQEKVDAFFVAQYSGLKGPDGKGIPDKEMARWYVTNIKKPEASGFKFRVKEGMLCAADDSGYNQANEAAFIAHEILAKGVVPATYPIRAPKRGALIVNRQRAEMLGITLSDSMGIEEYIEKIGALME